ncbi:MAG: zinc ribbon domain-containing protein [Nanoarchaeota archaeon]
MPLYEYQCTGCKNVYEVLKPIEERNQLPPCAVQRCDGQTERVVSMFNLIREGSRESCGDRLGERW